MNALPLALPAETVRSTMSFLISSLLEPDIQRDPLLVVIVLSPVPLLKEWSIDPMRMSHLEGL